MATPVAHTNGQTGVFVIPSDALTSAPAFVSTSANVQILDEGLSFTINGSNVVTGYSPATFMFAATDGSGNIHIYGLNLASSTQPTATQISSLSLPLASGAAINSVICNFNGASTNILQPTTIFVVLHIAGTTGCNTTGDVWEVVHYTDTAATAPTAVGIKTTQISDLYGPTGALAGLVLLDPVSSNLYLYANDSFSAPATVIAGGGIASIGTVSNTNDLAANGAAFTGSELFLSVTKTSNVDYLYRLPYTATTATLEYTATGTLTLADPNDGTNIYFADNVTGSPSTQTIWQQPLSGGAPTKLFSYTVPSSGTTLGQFYDLIGSNGSLLVVSGGSIDTSTGASTGTLGTLPVGTLSTSVTALGSGSYTGFLSAFMEPATIGTASSDLVFVNVLYVTTMPTAFGYSSEVLTPGNTVKQALTANSYFLENGASPFSGSVLHVSGITDTAGGEGGGSISAVDIATLVATPLKASGGTTYTVPSGFTPGLAGLSNSIGSGALVPASGVAGNSSGLAYDVSKTLIVPISITNTNVD
jgi:hypothetical protein